MQRAIAPYIQCDYICPISKTSIENII